jgi:DNA-binding response OmpR family regulator
MIWLFTAWTGVQSNQRREKDLLPKVPIGTILLEKKVIQQNQLNQALEEQKEHGGKLASNLLEKGMAAEEQLLLALSEQHGVPAVDLSRSIIPLEVLDLVPEEVARADGILPLRLEAGRILLAMADPQMQKIIDEVSFVTGKKVEPAVVLEGRLRQTIQEAYAMRKRDRNLKFFFGSCASFPEEQEDPNGFLVVISAEVPQADLTTSTDQGLVTIEVSLEDEEKPTSDSQKTILVVDDELEIQRLLEKALLNEGFRVVCASRGTEALAAIKKHRPDLVLLDAMLPEIHGFEICRKIKSSRNFSRVPVIMISAVYRGWRYAEDVKEVYGADDYFEKPFRLLPLVRRVRELLGTGPSQEELKQNAASCNQLLEQSVAAYQKRNFVEAEDLLRKVLALDPFQANAHYALANTLLAQEKIFDAIREYEQAIEIKPDLFAALRNLAVLYQNRGFRNKAVEMWERALRVCPDEKQKNEIRDQLMKLL